MLVKVRFVALHIQALETASERGENNLKNTLSRLLFERQGQNLAWPVLDVPNRGTSLTRKCTPLGPYRRPIHGVIWWSWGGGLFIMGEVPL